METLIVGAGAVGQVLGLHLQRGGARAAFFVRPEYAAETARGFTLRPLHRPRRPATLAPDGVLTEWREVAARRWDLVVLCVSSTALRRGDWLAQLGRAVGGASVLAVQPGLDDPEFVGARVPASQVVWGMFPLVSFAAAEGAGCDYWVPPLTRLPLSGAAERARAIAETLARGGLPSRIRPDVPRELAFGAAALDLHMVALECAGWSLASLRNDRALLAETGRALGAALATVACHHGARVPWALGRLRPWMVRLALRLLPRLAPFDVERYLRAHFSKVGDQTARQLATYVKRAAELGLDAAPLALLEERLHAARSAGTATPAARRAS